MYICEYVRVRESDLLTYMVTNHWLGLNPQIGRPLSRIIGAIGFFL
jgi:hypothetical protein